MARSLLDDDKYKLQFAGHETFPLRYGWLNKAYDQVARVISLEDGDTNSIFTDESAISLFGVGKNMVVSMRHWALAAGVIHMAEAEEGARMGRLEPTAFGTMLLEECDPYLEHPSSLWLIHWHLASRPARATTWYWAFNELNEPSIDRELVTDRLARRIAALRESGRMKESRITGRRRQCLSVSPRPQAHPVGRGIPVRASGLLARPLSHPKGVFRRGDHARARRSRARLFARRGFGC
jgi:hypothetical protein